MKIWISRIPIRYFRDTGPEKGDKRDFFYIKEKENMVTDTLFRKEGSD